MKSHPPISFKPPPTPTPSFFISQTPNTLLILHFPLPPCDLTLSIRFRVPSNSPSQAAEASRIPPSEGGEATGPSSPASQCRTSGPGESSRASEPPTDSELPSDMSPESIIRRPMVTAPPIEGNSDCRARPFHSELHFDQEAMRQEPSSKTLTTYSRGTTLSTS
ncbi:hypothetical protein AAG906_037542 [Vitis piasezkii]